MSSETMTGKFLAFQVNKIPSEVRARLCSIPQDTQATGVRLIHSKITCGNSESEGAQIRVWSGVSEYSTKGDNAKPEQPNAFSTTPSRRRATLEIKGEYLSGYLGNVLMIVKEAEHSEFGHSIETSWSTLGS